MREVRFMLYQLTRVVLAIAVVAFLATAAHACPTCTDGLAQSDPQHQSVAAGFYYSILFMMSVPYMILGTLGCLAYVSIRRAREQREAAAAAAGAHDE